MTPETGAAVTDVGTDEINMEIANASHGKLTAEEASGLMIKAINEGFGSLVQKTLENPVRAAEVLLRVEAAPSAKDISALSQQEYEKSVQFYKNNISDPNTRETMIYQLKKPLSEKDIIDLRQSGLRGEFNDPFYTSAQVELDVLECLSAQDTAHSVDPYGDDDDY